MSKSHPKISFAYPTFVLPGMYAKPPYPAHIGFKLLELPSKITFYVSAGLILDTARTYSFDVDVIFDGSSLIPGNRPAVDSRLLEPTFSENNDFITTSVTIISGIEVVSEGLYTIQVSLYAGDTNDADRELVDKHECHFVLAKNWAPAAMNKTE